MSVLKAGATGILKGFNWQTFLLGAGAGLVGEAVARPLLVELVKGGLAISTAAAGVVAQAKTEIAQAQQQAHGAQLSHADVSALVAELRALREEVATLKAASASTAHGHRASS